MILLHQVDDDDECDDPVVPPVPAPVPAAGPFQRRCSAAEQAASKALAKAKAEAKYGQVGGQGQRNHEVLGMRGIDDVYGGIDLCHMVVVHDRT